MKFEAAAIGFIRTTCCKLIVTACVALGVAIPPAALGIYRELVEFVHPFNSCLQKMK